VIFEYHLFLPRVSVLEISFGLNDDFSYTTNFLDCLKCHKSKLSYCLEAQFFAEFYYLSIVDSLKGPKPRSIKKVPNLNTFSAVIVACLLSLDFTSETRHFNDLRASATERIFHTRVELFTV